MKKFLCIPIAIFLLANVAYSQKDATVDEGVVINGIKWATRNLDAHNKFVENPEDYGAYFQWGRVGDGHEQKTSSKYPTNNSTVENGMVSGAQNFDANGQIINTHEAYGKFIKNNTPPADWRFPQINNLWNYGSEATPEKTVNDPCPDGWRMPTITEFESLGDGEWTNTPIAGRLFGSGTNTIFLPASGWRLFDGVLETMSANGRYWSSSTNNAYANYFTFNANSLFFPRDCTRAIGLSVRCVSDEFVGIIEMDNEKILIYPNPTTSELRIESGKLKIENVDIFDVYGRKILSTLSLNSQYTSIDISNLPVGVYIVKISAESGEVIRKIVKE
jgi:uncharacterized protein (TIGR02145 family)